jgi:hypothetical protein
VAIVSFLLLFVAAGGGRVCRDDERVTDDIGAASAGRKVEIFDESSVVADRGGSSAPRLVSSMRQRIGN